MDGQQTENDTANFPGEFVIELEIYLIQRPRHDQGRV